MNNNIRQITIPATRNPFVNAQLVPAGIDPETGEERFWASAWNSNEGCIGVLVTVSGKHRLYRFNHKEKQFGFYGASYAGNDIMWLSSFLDSITKLNLKTGETETFETGLYHALSVSGFIYDDITEKVFWATYCQDDMKRNGLSFDTKTNSVSKIHKDIPLKNNQLRYSVKNLDGTYTFINSVPDFELLLWDPVSDTVDVILNSQKPGPNLSFLEYTVVIQRKDGAIYLPAYGWFDPLKRSFVKGLTPGIDAAWFGSDSQYAYGSKTTPLGNTSVYRWDLKNGDIDFLTEIPDAFLYGFRLAGNCKILCVNIYGFFYRIDSVTGAIETSVKFDSDGVGRIDCIHRIDEKRLLCTPFITQRFYEINLLTGESIDLGRATGGAGEVLQLVEINKKVYMASYTKGQLVEYDPSEHAHFPENPRIVVNPPKNVMRPVAMCKNNDSVFYSCSHKYGYLGSTLIRYTPSAGESIFVENPLPGHMILSLEYDENLNMLVAATTFHADCRTCVPEHDTCIIALLNPDTLMPMKTMKIRAEQQCFHIFGKFSDDRYLCGSAGHHRQLEQGYTFYLLNTTDFKLEEYSLPNELYNQDLTRIYFTNAPGIFVTTTDEKVDVWNLNFGKFVKHLCDNPGFYKAIVQDDNIYMICEKEIIIVSIGVL